MTYRLFVTVINKDTEISTSDNWDDLDDYALYEDDATGVYLMDMVRDLAIEARDERNA